MPNSKTISLKIVHLNREIDVNDLNDHAWNRAQPVRIKTYWSGEKAPEARHFSTQLLWSDTALYIRFDANQNEPLIVSAAPDKTRKTMNLWDRDVCEIFIAPDKNEPNKYFEFEIAPTGEWIDLGIRVTPEKRETDWDYRSGMGSAASIENGRVVMAVKIPWRALGRTPKSGDIWLGNLFRCVGIGKTRGYLSWMATKTKQPSFHVPAKFGEFRFVK